MSGIKGSYNNWTYQEVQRSRNRGLHIWNGEQNFTGMFRPNPHTEDSKYYNKHQTKWYAEAAKMLIDHYEAEGSLPDAIEVNNYDYTFEE